MLKKIIVTNKTGIAFVVRVVEQGERYGRNMMLTHEENEPLVEFYDARHPFDFDLDGNQLGQFVSRYYISTLAKSEGGINLCGHYEGAILEEEPMRLVQEFMKPYNPEQYSHDWSLAG